MYYYNQSKYCMYLLSIHMNINTYDNYKSPTVKQLKLIGFLLK